MKRSRKGRVYDYPIPHGASPPQPMKHGLTLDHMKKEARNLLRGLQRRGPGALTRCHAIDPFADMVNPALDCARFIIARERGFNSWRKLKEIVRSLQTSGYGTLIVLLQKCTPLLRCFPSQNPHNPVPLPKLTGQI